MTVGAHPVAINALQFAASDEGWFDFSRMPHLDVLLAAVAEAGFTAIAASPPSDGSAALYAHTVREAGVELGPGYVAVDVDETGALLSREQNHRLLDQLHECEVDVAFVGLEVHPGSHRFRHPGLGVAGSDARLERIAALLDELAERAGGIRLALHPHIGSWVETEAETRAVLASTSTLQFGPDLGHLAWARADIPALLADFADRVAAVHVKDHSRRVLLASLGAGVDYAATVRAGLWREPGHGDASLDEALAAVPDDDSWIVIEVDRAPDMDAAASLARSAEWLRRG